MTRNNKLKIIIALLGIFIIAMLCTSPLTNRIDYKTETCYQLYLLTEKIYKYEQNTNSKIGKLTLEEILEKIQIDKPTPEDKHYMRDFIRKGNDAWGHPLLKSSDDNGIFIYSMGPNDIDEKGNGDDIKKNLQGDYSN